MLTTLARLSHHHRGITRRFTRDILKLKNTESRPTFELNRVFKNPKKKLEGKILDKTQSRQYEDYIKLQKWYREKKYTR